jgi:hypothetical protein
VFFRVVALQLAGAYMMQVIFVCSKAYLKVVVSCSLQQLVTFKEAHSVLTLWNLVTQGHSQHKQAADPPKQTIPALHLTNA